MHQAGLLLISLSCICFPQALPKLDQILPLVQDHVKDFELTLPDFICDEQITSRELLQGKPHYETVIESAFRGTQRTDEKGRPFIEFREIKTVNGRPAVKDQPLTGPFLFGGGFSSLLDEIFARQNMQYFNYKVIGQENVDGRLALAIAFETKKDQKVLLYREISGRQWLLKGKGKAWIDPESMNVMRLELQYLDPPLPEGVLTVSVDYAAVEINGKTFWMPRTVVAEQTVPNSKLPVTGQYIARYSNYHYFNVSVKIKY